MKSRTGFCQLRAPPRPKGMQIKELFDQSVFVRGAIAGVLREP